MPTRFYFHILLVTFYTVIIRYTETFWSPCTIGYSFPHTLSFMGNDNQNVVRPWT